MSDIQNNDASVEPATPSITQNDSSPINEPEDPEEKATGRGQ
ncbi:hypothetical protein [Agreia bicolorata]|nr:hypothetical protein [Agreia bicolorata]